MSSESSALRRFLRALPSPGHLVGAALVLCGLLLACLLPRTNGVGPIRPLANFASNGLNTLYLSLGILGLLSLAYAGKSLTDFKRLCWVMLSTTFIVQFWQKVIYHLIGWWPRPSGHDGGFPSGHATAACALAYLLTERMPALSPLWYAIAALIAWSRVEAGAHYPYQIVAGAILGFGIAIFFHRSLPRLGLPAAEPRKTREPRAS